MTTTVANDRLKQRFAKWDVDGSGELTRADFELEARQIAEAFGTTTASDKGKALESALVGMFERLESEAGVSGSITEAEFVGTCENLMFEQGEASFNRVLEPMVKAIVGLCDKNADGKINRAEFATWLKGVGVESADAATAFDEIDTDADGELSLDELLTSVRNFHIGKLGASLLG